MSTTATELPVSPASPAPGGPDPRVVWIDEVAELWEVHGATEAPFDLNEAVSARAPERPATGPLVFEVDAEGVHIVQDVLGAVYGAGASFDEARAEFEAALDDHLRFLRAHREELHARLLHQLPALERLFPGR